MYYLIGQSVDDLLEDMTSEERQLLLRTLKYFPMSPSGGLLWAIESFHSYFDSDIKQLLKEHPLEEVDEEGIPFWGG